jgi:hypothetical protein
MAALEDIAIASSNDETIQTPPKFWIASRKPVIRRAGAT